MGGTTFLFAIPNFVRGMASVLDLGSTLTVYNSSSTPAIADARATRADWLVVGQDLQWAMNMSECEGLHVEEAQSR